MIEYIRKILPRIQGYSKQLDKQEVFVDKSWIFIDEKNNHHEYIFHRDRRLIMSLNGIVKIGIWELLPNGKLLINRIDDEIMLQHMFIDDALLLLKMSGTSDLPFTLINQERIPDLDAVKYLERLENRKAIEAPDNNIKRILSDGRVSGSNFRIGDVVKGKNDELLSGHYETTNSRYGQWVILENGLIVGMFYVLIYLYGSRKIKIKSATPLVCRKGDKIINFSMLDINEKSILVMDRDDINYKMIIDTEGTIMKVINISNQNIYIALIIFIAFLIILALIFS